MKYAIYILLGCTTLTVQATTIDFVDIVCGNCGTKNKITVCRSSNQCTPSDLDNRPGEMLRSTLRYDVQYCKKCHYCNDRISDKPQAKEVQKVIAKTMPSLELKAKFVRVAEIVQAEIQACKDDDTRKVLYYKEAMFYLKAAWCCDDEGKAQEAVEYRKKAAEEMEKLLSLCKNPLEEIRDDVFVTLIDIYRRSGDFVKAEKLAMALIQYRTLSQKAAAVQLQLCKQKRKDRHTYAEVPNTPNEYRVIIK